MQLVRLQIWNEEIRNFLYEVRLHSRYVEIRSLLFDVLIVLYLCNAAWVKEPLKKKQVAVEKKTFKAEQIPHDHASGSTTP